MRKPFYNAQINKAHPFAKQLLFALLFNEPAGVLPIITSGTATTAVGRTPTSMVSITGGPLVRTSNTDGRCVHMDVGTSLLVSQHAWLPTNHITICIIRRKTDTTMRPATLFGNTGVNDRCSLFAPYSDGNIYWDFGGLSGVNRIAVSGLSFSTMPERLVVTAGEGGSSVWQNGIKVGNQSTAITRTSIAGDWEIGHSPDGGDEIDLNYFAVYDTQWSDDLCAWWSAEPYTHLYIPTIKKYMFLGASGSVVKPTKKGGKKGGGGIGGKDLYGPTLTVQWDSVNSFGSG